MMLSFLHSSCLRTADFKFTQAHCSRTTGAVRAVSSSVCAAPQTSWNAVKTTAGAALDLMLLPEDHQRQVDVYSFCLLSVIHYFRMDVLSWDLATQYLCRVCEILLIKEAFKFLFCRTRARGIVMLCRLMLRGNAKREKELATLH